MIYILLYAVINVCALIIMHVISQNVYKISPEKDKFSKTKRVILSIFDSDKYWVAPTIMTLIFGIVTVTNVVRLYSFGANFFLKFIAIELSLFDLFLVTLILLANAVLFLKKRTVIMNSILAGISFLLILATYFMNHISTESSNYVSVASTFTLIYLITFFVILVNALLGSRATLRLNKILTHKDKIEFKNEKNPEKNRTIYTKLTSNVDVDSVQSIFGKNIEITKNHKK